MALKPCINIGNLRELDVSNLWGGIIVYDSSTIDQKGIDVLKDRITLSVDSEITYDNGVGRSVRAYYYPKSFYEGGAIFVLDPTGDLEKEQGIPKNVLVYNNNYFKWETIDNIK